MLFPHTFLPLHIFEPRYRVLVSTVLKEGGAMGVVMLNPSNKSKTESQPALHRIAGSGRIVHYTELADGRFMILLRGLARVAIEKELESTEPFRRFLVSHIVEDEMVGQAAEDAMTTLQSCVTQLAMNMSEGGPELLKAVSMTKTPGELADLLASAFIGEPATQQKLLETTRATVRVDRVVEAMAEMLLNLPSQDKTESSLN